MIASKFTRALAATVAGGSLAAILAAGATAGMASSASAATAPAPAAGVAPAATTAAGDRIVGYEAGHGTVWLHNPSTGCGSTPASRPAAAAAGSRSVATSPPARPRRSAGRPPMTTGLTPGAPTARCGNAPTARPAGAPDTRSAASYWPGRGPPPPY